MNKEKASVTADQQPASLIGLIALFLYHVIPGSLAGAKELGIIGFAAGMAISSVQAFFFVSGLFWSYTNKNFLLKIIGCLFFGGVLLFRLSRDFHGIGVIIGWALFLFPLYQRIADVALSKIVPAPFCAAIYRFLQTVLRVLRPKRRRIVDNEDPEINRLSRQVAEEERGRLQEQEYQEEQARREGNLAMGLNADGSSKPEPRDIPNLWDA